MDYFNEIFQKISLTNFTNLLQILTPYPCVVSGAARNFVRRNNLVGRPRRGSGGLAPPWTQGNFLKFAQNFVGKFVGKSIIFSYFSQKILKQ